MNESTKLIQDILKRLEKLERENNALKAEIAALKEAKKTQLFTHKEAIKYLGISSQTLYNWVNLGKIQKVCIGIRKNMYLIPQINQHKDL